MGQVASHVAQRVVQAPHREVQSESIAECIAFARGKGYRKLVLWTQSNLFAARAIYKSRGFRHVKSEPHDAYGQKLVAETWELKLST